MNNRKPIVAVFGGSRVVTDSPEYREAYRVGELVARNDLVLINGGYAGTMEASARGAHEAGGRVLGVTSPIFLESRVNDYVHEEIPTDDLYSRIRGLVVRADGFIVLKGSQGTLAELTIVWNLAAIDPGFTKPIVLLGAFWHEVLRTFEQYLAVRPEQSAMLHVVATPEEAVSFLRDRLTHPNTVTEG